MKKNRARLLWCGLGATTLVVLILLGIRLWVPGRVAKSLNGVHVSKKVIKISEAAKRLHKKLFIADLHADPLLWGRDLSKRSAQGHIDFPRMREGRLFFQ